MCIRDSVITTCNGGDGTDWNVIQNWSGTYGGDVNKYGRCLLYTSYPYTPESFPWFYDKEQWIKYLDMLVENRMNSLYPVSYTHLSMTDSLEGICLVMSTCMDTTRLSPIR